MDKCLSLLEPRTFNKPAFAGVIFFAATGLILSALMLTSETKEESQFKCYDLAEELRDRCYDAYDGQYNKKFPLYGFVFLNFPQVLFVCLVYSQYVKQRVENLYNGEEENPSETTPLLQSGCPSRKLFTAYVVHLLVRVVSLAIFLVLQWIVMYPIKFPSTCTCTCSTAMECDCVGTNVNQNSTAISSSPSATAHHNCTNHQAGIKTWCGIVLFAVNSLFCVLSVVEVTSLIWKAANDNEFTEDGKFWACHLIGNQGGLPAGVQWFVESLKSRILNETEYIMPLAHGGITNRIKRDDTFVDLTIQTNRKLENFSDLDRDAVLGSYAAPGEGSVTINSTELFAPNTDTQNPRTILAVGRAGIGKTSLATKILRDWAKGVLSTANQAVKCFDFVFLLQFRFLNFENNISLKKLLRLSPYSVNLTDEVFQHILKSPEKVLLVFDGLDEAKKLDTIETDRQYENSNTADMPVAALFAKLASGKLLDGATILTTTRSTAIPGAVFRFYKGLNYLRLVEILGFTAERIQEYVNKIVAPEEMKESIWNHINSNINLLSLCYIPVNCAIMCTYLVKRFQNDPPAPSRPQPLAANATRAAEGEEPLAPRVPQPTTLTEIYKATLKNFILNHHSSYRNKEPEKRDFNPNARFRREVEETLQKLGKLAKKGLEEGKLIFDETEILEFANLTDEEMKDMVESGLLHHLPEGNSETSMYEEQYSFIHLTFQEFLAARVVASQNPEELGAFASSAVTDNSKMQIVLRFAAGLLRCQDSSDRVDSLLEPLIASSLGPRVKPHKLMLLLHCLLELQSEEMAREISSLLTRMDKLLNLSFLSVNDADCASLVFFLKHTREIELVMAHCNIGPGVCAELAKLVESGNLSGLNLNHNDVGDAGLESISEALQKETCKLEMLSIVGNGITAVGAQRLSKALQSEHCKLTELNLGGNQLTDEGAEYLRDGIVNCKLKVLHVANAGITAVGAKHFSEALENDQCHLTELNLGGNQLTDEGAVHLGNALLYCKLDVLQVRDAGITAVGTRHFSETLKSDECQLTELDLGGNQLTDEGAEHLGAALMNCKLKVLYVIDAEITALGTRHFRKTMICNDRPMNMPLLVSPCED